MLAWQISELAFSEQKQIPDCHPHMTDCFEGKWLETIICRHPRRVVFFSSDNTSTDCQLDVCVCVCTMGPEYFIMIMLF